MATTSGLDARRVEEIVAALCDRVGGDWLLIGGALVALWVEPRRMTEDVDLVSMRGHPDDRLALMQLAADLGLPIEAVNSAADFFVRRIPGWARDVEPFRHGARGRVFRPSPTLFLLLKLSRLSPTDLEDCLGVIERAKRDTLAVDAVRVLAALAALPLSTDPEIAGRRVALRRAVEAAP
jgi:hypothetical protein